MPEEQQKLDVEAIVEKAFGYFDRFVKRGNQLDGVLLGPTGPNVHIWAL
jgi:hypothetical protein